MSDIPTCRDCGEPFRLVTSDRDLERSVTLHMYSATCVHGGNRFVETELKPKGGEMIEVNVTRPQVESPPEPPSDRELTFQLRELARQCYGDLTEAIEELERRGLEVSIRVGERCDDKSVVSIEYPAREV